MRKGSIRVGAWLGLIAAGAWCPAPASALVSKAEERQVGRRVVEEVRREFRVLDEPYLRLYLAGIGARVAAAMGAREFEAEFQVVADPRVNAFAVPGGYVFVTSQTILVCGDESELAGVVAHEVGHVEGRHLAHRLQKASVVNLASLAAVLAGAFLTKDPKAGAAVTSFAVAGAQTKMLQYSREDEEDADLRAVRALQGADYDGWGLVRFMDAIRRESPAPEGVPAYLFTHPLPENRAATLAAILPAEPRPPATPAAQEGLWRAQARVLLADPRPWGRALLERRVTAHPESPAAHLGLALQRRAEGQFAAAVAALEEAARLAPDDPEVAHERAATWLRQGRGAEAVALLEELRARGRATRPALQDLAWAHLEADRGAEALAAVAALEAADPRWPRLAYFKGLALGKAGRPAEGFALLGDHYRDEGDPDQAARHYREALKRLPPGEEKGRVEEALKGVGRR